MNKEIDKDSESYRRDNDFFDKLWKDEMKYRRQKNKYSSNSEDAIKKQDDNYNNRKP